MEFPEIEEPKNISNFQLFCLFLVNVKLNVELILPGIIVGGSLYFATIIPEIKKTVLGFTINWKAAFFGKCFESKFFAKIT